MIHKVFGWLADPVPTGLPTRLPTPRPTGLPTALLAAALLSACGAPGPAAPPPPAGAAPLGLPHGYVRTDGHGDLLIASAGQAACPRTSPAEAAAAAAAANAARRASGQPPVAVHPTLQRVAEQQACEMAGRGTMTHVSERGGRPGPRLKAAGYRPVVTTENIAAGRMDIGRVLAEWGSSPLHLANVVRPGLRHMGIGHAVGADGRTVYWSTIYAQPR